MAVGDIWQANIHQVVNGNPVMNVLHYMESVAVTTPADDASDIADGIANGWLTSIAALLSDQWSAVSIGVRRVHPGFSIPFTMVLTGGEAIVGGVAGEPLPSNAPVVITKYTDLASRRGRGRLYQSGVPEASQDGGQLTVAALASWTTAAQDLLTNINEVGGAGVWSPVVHSTVGGGINNTIEQVVVRPNIANMRPRRSPAASI